MEGLGFLVQGAPCTIVNKENANTMDYHTVGMHVLSILLLKGWSFPWNGWKNKFSTTKQGSIGCRSGRLAGQAAFHGRL